MAPLTPAQIRARERVEAVIRLGAPALDLVLAFGERVSRLVERDDVEYYPPRASSEGPPPQRASEGAGD